MIDIIDIFNKKQYDYSYLYNHERVIKRINKDTFDFNVIIGVKNRVNYLKTVLYYFEYAKKYSSLKINIIVVEIDDVPKNKENCENVDYIFIPIDIINTNNLYSRSLGFNVGYMFSNVSKYYMFHDCDIMVPYDFFVLIEKCYLNKEDFTWLQPFTKKRLLMLNEKTSNNIMNGAYYDLRKSVMHINYKPANIGAPGGTTIMKREVFEDVGGFDPENFYGYAPEDSIFMTKLACLEQRVDSVPSCHLQNGSHYADNPPIELYHLHHEPTLNENPYFVDMSRIHDKFLMFKYEQKMEYINIKKESFKKEKDIFLKINTY